MWLMMRYKTKGGTDLVKRDLHLWHTMLPCSCPAKRFVTGESSLSKLCSQRRSAWPVEHTGNDNGAF